MYTVINERYLEAKKDDYKRLIEYLESYYKFNITDSNESLRIVHENSWIIMMWIKELKRTKVENKFLNEIFINIIATVHSLIHVDIKIGRFLLRNSIENFLRFFQIYINEINISDTPDQIFDTIFLSCNSESIVHKNFQILRSIYKECCLYVHSACLNEDNLCSSLIQYDKFYNRTENNSFLNDFNKAYYTISNLILIYNKDIFDNMKYDNQLILREYVDKLDLRSILEFWCE